MAVGSFCPWPERLSANDVAPARVSRHSTMMAVMRNLLVCRTSRVVTGCASARSSSCVLLSSCAPLYARPLRRYQLMWSFPRGVFPPISHAIPALVFRDLNRNRWDSKVYGALFQWTLGELHAECGRGTLISTHKGTVLRGKLRIPWRVSCQSLGVVRSRGGHTLGL